MWEDEVPLRLACERRNALNKRMSCMKIACVSRNTCCVMLKTRRSGGEDRDVPESGERVKEYEKVSVPQ